MPQRPLHPCSTPGCPQLVRDAPRCPACTTATSRARGTAHERGYGARWQRERARFLAANPLCVIDLRESGTPVPATVVDHVVPHKGDKALFWDRSNWQPLCKPHHDAKTATEDGGFGRATRRAVAMLIVGVLTGYTPFFPAARPSRGFLSTRTATPRPGHARA